MASLCKADLSLAAAAGLVLAASPFFVTFECCSPSVKGVLSSAQEELKDQTTFAFVPGIGWLEASFASLAGVLLGGCALFLYGLVRMCFRPMQLFRNAFAVSILAVVIGSVVDSTKALDDAVQHLGGAQASFFLRNYVEPGFVSVRDIRLKIDAASYFDEHEKARIIMPTGLPTLNQTQVDEALRGIHKLRRYWRHISEEAGPLPMFTLGHASYLHGENILLNEIIQSEFAWLHRIVQDKLESYLGEPVEIQKKANIPGFHIFYCSAVWWLPVATVHSDLQYQRQFSEALRPGEMSVLSFTLPLQLPRFGTPGLFTFTKEITATNAEGSIPRNFRRFPGFVRELHPYHVGELVVHGGALNHQIAPSQMLFPQDARITLQGHGYFDEKKQKWMLYW
mmetsp:Transcript_29200/g.71217  ORF Transcript_29200/g.71217 Transcript_29200/m.71217 type:complete len:395 (-) Transcript_29200:15-1199(-)